MAAISIHPKRDDAGGSPAVAVEIESLHMTPDGEFATVTFNTWSPMTGRDAVSFFFRNHADLKNFVRAVNGAYGQWDYRNRNDEAREAQHDLEVGGV